MNDKVQKAASISAKVWKSKPGKIVVIGASVLTTLGFLGVFFRVLAFTAGGFRMLRNSL